MYKFRVRVLQNHGNVSVGIVSVVGNVKISIMRKISRKNVFSCKLRCISIKTYEKHNISFYGKYCHNVSVEI